MTTLSQMLDGVADATEVDRASLTVIARNLREAGLIAVAGRGNSAAKMTEHCAVSLLLGVGSPGFAKDVASRVERLGDMRRAPDKMDGFTLRQSLIITMIQTLWNKREVSLTIRCDGPATRWQVLVGIADDGEAQRVSTFGEVSLDDVGLIQEFHLRPVFFDAVSAAARYRWPELCNRNEVAAIPVLV